MKEYIEKRIKEITEEFETLSKREEQLINIENQVKQERKEISLKINRLDAIAAELAVIYKETTGEDYQPDTVGEIKG